MEICWPLILEPNSTAGQQKYKFVKIKSRLVAVCAQIGKYGWSLIRGNLPFISEGIRAGDANREQKFRAICDDVSFMSR